jgi:REP element-mobilizing transposase RayT
MPIPTAGRNPQSLRMGYSKLRTGRRSIAGQIYLVTFHTAGRAPVFAEPRHAMDACRTMSSPEAWPASRLLAWVLMPDHWHGLIELGDEALPLSVARLKAMSSRQLRVSLTDVGQVWAAGYHDRALRREVHVLNAARYLVLNPVRAGLVRRPGDYAYWDATWLEAVRG